MLEQKRGHALLDIVQTCVQQYTHVASYIPFGSEIDITPINDWLLKEKQLYIPRGSHFLQIRSDDDLELHPFGFFQPKKECARFDQVECFLVPAVAFDYKKNRLGYGHGQIDRLLAKYPNVYTIGINYREMIIDELPIEPHDVALHDLIHD